MRTRITATLCCALFLAAPAGAQEEARDEQPPAVEPPVAGWLPSLADLEAAGATIGEIRIRPQNIFDLSDSREDNFLYRIANAIHVVTRPEVVRKTLLFKTGDRVSLRVIEESERLLRSTLQVYAVRIQPVAIHDGVVSRTVDLEVVTRDRWTLDPSVSASRTGGANTDRVGLKEANLFGTGLSVGFSRSSNVDRTSNTFDISHPHAFGPFTNASYSYADTSDGRSWATSVTRPFFALDSRYTAGASAGSIERSEPVYVSGVNTGTYRHQQGSANVFGGWSAGLIDGWTRRHTVGLQYEDNSYARIAGESPEGELPSDLTLAAPYYRFELIQDRFRTGINFNQIAKPEDFNLGLSLTGQLGRSLSWLGSTRQQWLYSTSIAKGFDVAERGQLRTSAGFTGRYASAGEQQLSTLAAQYFHRQQHSFTFFGSLTGSMVRNPDVPNPLTLGGDNDLRGYPLRYQSGNKSVLVNLEERAYTDWYPFRLIRVGGAVFYDGGRAWGGSNPNTANSGWLNDVGFGLRLLTDRSAVGNVLHIDVAFPLNREPSIDAVQLLVYTKINL
jgi:outer membrane protein assembly factor BamA